MAKQQRALIALIGLQALTMVPTAAMPAFVGYYVDGFGYTLQQAGRVASVETVAMAFGQLTVLLLIHPGWNIRRTVFAALCLFIVAQFLSLWPGNHSLFAAARFLSGLCGGGIMFAVAGAFIASLPRPDRPFAVLYGTMFIVGPIGLFALPHVFDAAGARAVYIVLGVLALLSLAGVRYCPQDRERRTNAVGSASGKRLPLPAMAAVALLLVSFTINYISNGGVWIYLDRIGASMSIPESSRGNLLALGMAVGVIGTVAAIACSNRPHRYLFITLGQILLLLSYACLLWIGGKGGYLAGACLLNIAVTFYTPFYLAQMSVIDPSGRSATLGMLGFAFGYGLGPAVLSLFLVGGNFTGPIVAAGAAVVMSLALLWGAAAVARALSPQVGNPAYRI